MQCPVCRANNSEEGNCRRCKADLSLLWTLEQQHDALLRLATEKLSTNAEEAVGTAELAQQTRDNKETRRVLALAYLARRDFAKALTLWQSLTQTESSNSD